MLKYKWFGNLYSDWFREPISPIERTWCWPVGLIEGQDLIRQKLGINIPDDYPIAINGWLYLRTDYLRLLRQWGIFVVPFKLIGGISKEKQNFETAVLPKYKGFLLLWRNESKHISNMENVALWKWLNEIMRIEAKYRLEIVYAGAYGFLFDSLLGRFYKKFVKDDSDGYYELLAGFPNRTYEMNVALFELSEIEQESENFKQKFSNFLDEFGLEKSDWDLALPVLREHPQAILHLIESYRSHPELDPRLRLELSQEKRNKKFEYALNHLKYPFITRPIFKWLVRWAQNYVPLRETRQHYIGAGTYFLRQGLKLLASRLGLDPEMIFYLEKAEIDKAVQGKFDLSDFQRIAKERYDLRELQKKHPPYE